MASARTPPLNNIEELLARIGNANRFQVLLVIWLKMPSVFSGWTMLEMSFVKAAPDWCCVPTRVKETPNEYCYHDNGTFGDECPKDPSNCSHRVFETGMKTMVNEWDLVCDKEWLTNLSISVHMAGVLVAALVAGYLSDVLGRKKTFFIGIVILFAFSIGAGFSTSWQMFTVFRFMLGFSCGMYVVVAIPYQMEFLSPLRREIPSTIPTFNIGGCLMTLVAWQLEDWRWVHWLCAVLVFPMLLGWFFVPESLRWLTIKGKINEAEDVVKYIARVNRKEVPEECRQVLQSVYHQELKSKSQGKRTYHYFDIYRGWKLFKLSINLQFVWASVSFCSYGIAFAASTMDLNLYISLVLTNAPSIPYMIILQIFMARVGRRTAAITQFILAMALGLASLAVFKLVPEDDGRNMITSILCLTAYPIVGGAWSAIMVINNESYPTVLRSLGYGAVNMVARIGGILAPFAFNFKSMPVMSYSLLAGVMGISAVLIFLLEETRGKDMPDTLFEVSVGAPGHEGRVKEEEPLLGDSISAINDDDTQPDLYGTVNSNSIGPYRDRE